MKNFKNLLFLLTTALASIVVGWQPLQAAHLVGGELTYQCAGAEEYILSLTIYRDCNCIDCAEFDDPANITIFDGAGNYVENLSLFSPNITNIPPETDGLCLESLPDVCVEEGVYIGTAVLPPIAGGYQVVYQRCCRNNTIANIVDPGGTGSTYVANIPETEICDNSSPTFNNFPPIVICVNSPLVFDHAASDLDGDELVYEICEPSLGASTTTPAPVIASSPPYAPVTWLPPYTAEDPLGGTPAIAIDSETGELTAFPDMAGQFVVGVCVSEYRDGVLLSTNTRDFQFNVADCQVVLAQTEANVEDDTVCEGQDVVLTGEIFGGDEFSWSPEDNLDDPTSLTPTVVGISETTSFVLSVVNNLTGCADEDTITIFVASDVVADAGEDVSFCSSSSTQLNGSGGDSYEWSPEAGLSCTDCPDPIATPSEETSYTLTVYNEDASCLSTDEVVVTPVAESDPGTMPTDEVIVCSGESTGVVTEGAVVADGDVLAYLLHNNAADPLASILFTNSDSGDFNADLGLNTNQVYYISVVAGPAGADGLPDTSSECLNIAGPTPVVFLKEVKIGVVEYCDFTTGEFFTGVSVTGGLPQYDNSVPYQITGESAFQYYYGDEQVVMVFPEGTITSYSYIATEPCGVSMKGNSVYCEKTPIELASFTGEVLVEGNLLKWVTASEDNNDYFTLEHSMDGINFTAIKQIDGAGNSITLKSYEYLDKDAVAGMSYYRLKQTDLNGDYSYGDVITLVRGESDTPISTINVSPIPSNNYIQISFVSSIESTIKISVFDVAGHLVSTRTAASTTGINQITQDISSYATGMYLLQVNDGYAVQTSKFVKN